MASAGDRSDGGPVAAILIGGRSSRLGRPKSEVEIGGMSLLRRVVEAVRAVADEVMLVGKAGMKNPLPGLPCFSEEHEEPCALAGLVCALEAAGERRVLVTACDHPFLAPSVLALLAEVPADRAARVPEVGGRLEPLVAVYRASWVLPAFRRRLGAGRLALHAAVRELDPDIAAEADLRERDPELLSFVNVNTPEDLISARRTASRLNPDDS